MIYLCLRTVKLQSCETTAVHIISVGNGIVLIEGFQNMVIGQIQCLSEQYTFHYGYKKLSTPVYLCFRSGSLVGEFYYWPVGQKSHAYQFLNARCEYTGSHTICHVFFKTSPNKLHLKYIKLTFTNILAFN